MKTKFFDDKFIIWLVKLGGYESTEEPIKTYVVADTFIAAYEAAMNWSNDYLEGDNLVMSIEIVSNCVLDGRK